MNCFGSKIEEFDEYAQINATVIDQPKIPHKVLMLGIQDAGKTTFLRQMRALRLGGFSSVDTTRNSEFLRSLTLDNMKKIIVRAEKEGVLPQDKVEAARKILVSDKLDIDVGKEIKELWAYQAIKSIYEKKNQLGVRIDTNAKYYFENAIRFSDSELFRLTNQDHFMVNMPTTGIQEIKFTQDNDEITLIDIGGSKPSRRKWGQVLDDSINCVLYFVGLDDFDNTTDDEDKKNRLLDSLELFEQVTALECCSECTWIVVFNKADLFEKKILTSNISDIFEGISKTDATDFILACTFMLSLYQKSFKGKKMSHLITNSLDSEQINKVITHILSVLK